MSSVPPASPAPDLGKARESISQFVARILDQLSISAWLPAGSLVFGLLFVGQISQSRGLLQEAIVSMGRLGWSAIALLLGATVLATIATQAFGFGAIRLLEGYWGVGPIGRSLADLRCPRHIRRRERLEMARKQAVKDGLAFASMEMVQEGFPAEVILAVQSAVLGGTMAPAPAAAAHADDIQWRDYAAPRAMRRLVAAENALQEYPQVNRRVLPTKLGNIVRSGEERAYGHKESGLESWVMRVFNSLPVALQSQHDEHRNRLDLYATMIFVLLLLGLLGIAVLYEYRMTAAGVGLAALGGMWLSYRALLSSARAYASALEAIGEWEREQRATTPVQVRARGDAP